MEEAKPFENTAIPAPLWAPVRVRNRDSGGGGEPEIQRSLVRPPGYSAAALVASYPLAGCEFGISNISDQEIGL